MLNSAKKFCFFLFFIPISVFSGNNDSLKIKKNLQSSITRFFTANQFEYADSVDYLDNSLYNFQNYLERNHLGNSGLPFNSFNFRVLPDQLGFNYSKNNYQNYFYTPQNIKFYNTRTPYTDLFYITGTKQEQVFKMVFSYNVKKNWNVTANFYRIHSLGFYLRQSTNDNFVSVSSNYKSKSNRYNFLAAVNYNSAKNDENGGIKNDSSFQNGGVIDKQLIDVNLSAGKRSNNNRNVFFKQYLNVGHKLNDSAEVIPQSRFILTSEFNDNKYVYADDSTSQGYYSNFYDDSLKTHDSIYFMKIENELAWKRLDNKMHRGINDMIGFGFSVKDQVVKIRQNEIDTIYNNISIGAEFYNTYSKNKLWWKISGNYVLAGYNKNDLDASATIKKALIDSLNLFSLSATTKSQSADFIYQHYSSNNFRWNNNFGKMQETHFAFNFLARKYSFALSYDFGMYNNIFYFDNYAIAQQYKGYVPVVSVNIKKDFVFHNWHLNNKISYQYVPDSSVIRLPEFISEHSLYYENNLFKGAMHLQIGASLFFTSAYYSNKYMPATGQFYLQDEKKYGSYPFIDFFINVQVKSVRVFVKVDHLNSGLMGNTYMLTPHYPMNDRAFKLGISWRFMD